MFQFPGLAPLRVTDLAASRVAPFGHPEITAYVQLPQAYRSLSRPSSPLDAKASTVRLIAFDLDLLRCQTGDLKGRLYFYGVDSSTLFAMRFPCGKTSPHPDLRLSKSEVSSRELRVARNYLVTRDS